MSGGKYISTIAAALETKQVYQWIIVFMGIVILVQGIVIQRISSQQQGVLVIPGAVAGVYTPGNVPQKVILDRVESFVNNITNYDPDTVAGNINSSLKMMTIRCRQVKYDSLVKLAREIKQIGMAKSFYIGDSKVIRKNPYTLEYKGRYQDISPTGNVIGEGTQVVRLVLVPQPKTQSNFLGIGVDNYKIVREAESK